uniref:COesterase domain-containing protein n=1 Tax=Macrostomum lignano TaxID=282301 RepID=A0A1I8FDF6_9PLAT
SRTQILAQSTGLIIESVASQRARWSRSLVANGNGDEQSFTWNTMTPSSPWQQLAERSTDASDNKFIAKYLAMVVDQIAGSNRTNLLNAVLSKYCRQPVPDPICVEADEARTARQTPIECPSGYLPGDRVYYYRRLNESCSH